MPPVPSVCAGASRSDDLRVRAGSRGRAPRGRRIETTVVTHSALTPYQQCPLRYRFKYVDGLPETVVSSALIFGGVCHRVPALQTVPILVAPHRGTTFAEVVRRRS